MDEIRQIVGFQLDEQPYGFPIGDVREILQMVEIRPVPDAPVHLVGAINVRGKVVPVLDLRMILGLAPRAPELNTPIVVLDDGSRAVGLIVDGITDVVAAEGDSFEPPDDSYPMCDLLESVCKLESEMLLVFDAEKLLGKGVLPEQPLEEGGE